MENDLPDIRWHDLRSTFCTLLLKNDFNPKAVSRLMGRWAMQKRLLRWMYMEIIGRLSLTVIRTIKGIRRKTLSAYGIEFPPPFVNVMPQWF